MAIIPAGQRLPARYDPLQAYINQARVYPLLTREEEHELAVRYPETRRSRGRAPAGHRQPAAGRQDRPRVPQGLPQPARPGAGGQHRPDAGGEEVRPLPRREALLLRGLVDPRLHPQVHPQQLAAGQDRHHAGAAQALLQPAQGEGEARGAGLRAPGPSSWPSGSTSPRRRCGDGAAAGRLGCLARRAGARRRGRARRAVWTSCTDRSAAPDRTVENREFGALLREKLEAFGETLKGRDREIFELRTTADEPLTLQEIGDRYGITRERARQIERRMMDRLKAYLKQELGDAVEVALESFGE